MVQEEEEEVEEVAMMRTVQRMRGPVEEEVVAGVEVVGEEVQEVAVEAVEVAMGDQSGPMMIRTWTLSRTQDVTLAGGSLG